MARTSDVRGSGKNKRLNDRVSFSQGVAVEIVSIDGTWRRECRLLEVGEDDAILSVAGSVAGLNSKEFFLVLSTSGAFAAASSSVVNGDQVDVKFLTKRSRIKVSD